MQKRTGGERGDRTTRSRQRGREEYVPSWCPAWDADNAQNYEGHRATGLFTRLHKLSLRELQTRRTNQRRSGRYGALVWCCYTHCMNSFSGFWTRLSARCVNLFMQQTKRCATNFWRIFWSALDLVHQEELRSYSAISKRDMNCSESSAQNVHMAELL